MNRDEDKKSRIIIILTLALMVVISSAVGVTMSMLTYTPAQKANIFTFSDVSILLREEKWDALDNDPYARVLYPGRTIPKDPKIENNGRNDLYAYLEVIVPKAELRVGADDETVGLPAVTELFSYQTNTADWIELADCRRDEEDRTVRIYAYKRPLKAGETTGALFEAVTFVNMLEGELEMGSELMIDVNAYAIQTDSLDVQGDTDEERAVDAFEKYKLQEAADKE